MTRALALLPIPFLLITAADTPPPPEVHVVAAGETLSSISDQYDTPGGAYRLAYVNRHVIGHPDLITAGQRLTLTTVDGPRWHPRPTAAASRSQATSSDGVCGGDLPTCDILACESGGDVTAENPTSSASGKWQVIDSTWGGYQGYARASDAPESVQDAFARELWDGGAGRGHWAC